MQNIGRILKELQSGFHRSSSWRQEYSDDPNGLVVYQLDTEIIDENYYLIKKKIKVINDVKPGRRSS